MPIKFKCPHCQKGLSVKEELAGLRKACPACKKPLTIPAPASAPADIEALAASALADEPAPQDQVSEPTTIDLNCPACDEPIHMSIELGGKQAPCPECKRIIKVPMPAKKDPRDWRKLEARMPTLAKKDNEPAPEGAWGSTNKAVVSREALEEADAIPVAKDPLTLQQKIKRGAWVAAGIGALVIGWILLSNYWFRSLQDRAITQALSYVGGTDGKDKLKIAPEAAGEVYRALGEMHLLAGKVEEARDSFKNARSKARAGHLGSFDRDAALLDLALTQIDLGGSADQVDKKKRLSWEDASRQWEQTLKAVSDVGRATALRQVCRQVLKRAPDTFSRGMAVLSDSLEPPAKKDAKARKPRVVALLLALSKPDRADGYFPPLKKGEIPELAGQMIRDPDWKKRKSLAFARVFFVKAEKEPVLDRLQCLLSVALIAFDQGHNEEAKNCVKAANLLVANAPKDIPTAPWLLLEWAQLANQVNPDGAQSFSAFIGEPALKARLELEKYRRQARESTDLGEESWSQAVPDKNVLAHAQALQEYARNKARNGGGSAVLTAIESLEPEKIRPLGFAGVAVGVQEQGK